LAGGFTLSLAHGGNTFTTDRLPFDASAADVQEALLSALAEGGLSGAQLSVVQRSVGRYELSFAGSLGGSDLSLIQVDAQADTPSATLTVTQVGATVPQAALEALADPDLVIDFGVQPLEVKTGPSTDLTLDMDGALGGQTRVSGQMTVDAFGFVRVAGGFSFEQSISTVYDTAGNAIAVDRLVMGVGAVDAFIGANGGTNEAIGLEVQDLDFALALFAEREPAAGQVARSWTALTGQAGEVGLVGLPQVSLTGSGLALDINRPAADGSVLDFASTDASGADLPQSDRRSIDLSTGPGSSLTLDLAGRRGPVLQASGELALSVDQFFQARGAFAVSAEDTSVLLADGTTADVRAVRVGAQGLSAFAGMGGAYDDAGQLSADATGLMLDDVEFGLALFGERLSGAQIAAGDAARSWTALQASAGQVGLVGIPDLTLSASSLSVEINRGASDGSLVDFLAQPVVVQTGAGETPSSITLTMDASQGEIPVPAASLRLMPLGSSRRPAASASRRGSVR
jgi:hypothetical protein